MRVEAGGACYGNPASFPAKCLRSHRLFKPSSRSSRIRSEKINDSPDRLPLCLFEPELPKPGDLITRIQPHFPQGSASGRRMTHAAGLCHCALGSSASASPHVRLASGLACSQGVLCPGRGSCSAHTCIQLSRCGFGSGRFSSMSRLPV